MVKALVKKTVPVVRYYKRDARTYVMNITDAGGHESFLIIRGSFKRIKEYISGTDMGGMKFKMVKCTKETLH